MEDFSFTYEFEGKVWRSGGKGGWYFISLEKSLSKDIRSLHKESEEGWGRLKATVRINKTEIATAIWFDKKHDTYLLPIKAVLRKKEGITDGSEIKGKIEIKI